MTKFSPSLKLMKKTSIVTKGTSPNLKKRDSQITPINPFNENSTQRPSKFITTSLIIEKSFFLPKSNLTFQRNAQSDPYTFNSSSSKSYTINKLSMNHSYLLTDHYSFGHKSMEFNENNEENMDREGKSTLTEKIKKINKISDCKLSNETYFTPYHWHLFNKMMSKDDNSKTKDMINGKP